MPDIDIDFCIERRQEVIDYVGRKYGKDHVAQIVTFGTLKARGVLRDVGRVLDMPYAQVDAIAKTIPKELNITLDGALKESKEFKDLYESDEQIKYLVDMSRRLEGLPRHASMHAAGVVICAKPVEEYVPLSRASDGSITTQYIMTTLEELGLLKMDFLGLRNLTVIQNAVRFVEKDHNIKLDMHSIDYDDKKVLASIGTGNTEGIFQLESGGMKGFMKELKPQNLEDIIAGISLYRPGPMDFIPKYLEGKNNTEAITYDCPQLEHILEPTYGCIVYQEQVMQIVMKLAGYTLGRSDLVRRAMSKKKADVMAKERQYFVYGNEELKVPGCINNGISEDVANKIFDDMTDFAKYAFNKSHAAVYAIVAYQTAYLKCYYPTCFMAALMSSVKDNSSKVAMYIAHCRQMGIEILPPDINEGVSGFSVSGNAIRFGLSGLKSVGTAVIDRVVRERDENGPFKDFKDFLMRMSSKDTNKKTVEALILGGAFDSFGLYRKQLMLAYPVIADEVAREKKNSMAGQFSFADIFGEEFQEMTAVKYPDVPEYDQQEKLSLEKNVLGVYVSGHPLLQYTDMLDRYTNALTTDFQVDEESGSPKVKDQIMYTVGGIITTVSTKVTKNGQNMAFVTLEDMVGTVEVVVFPRDYDKCRSLLFADSKVLIKGRAQASEEGGKLIASEVMSFDEAENGKHFNTFRQAAGYYSSGSGNMNGNAGTGYGNYNNYGYQDKASGVSDEEVWVCFENMEHYNKEAEKFSAILENHRGLCPVMVQLRAERQIKNMGRGFLVNPDDTLMEELAGAYGGDKVLKRKRK